jgi:penicillin-binding protein 2
MLNPNQKRPSPFRLSFLGGFLAVFLCLYIGVLYNTQIVHGAEYREQAVRTITRQETVTASRGIITDRNGKTLVSNRQTFDLTFDPSLLGKEDDENAAILRLLTLCRQKQIAWTDNLPLSRTAPYAYTVDSAGDIQRGRFVKFLQKAMKLASGDMTADDLSAEVLQGAGLTADGLVARMREHYAIPADWSETDARDVLGVLYELEVRKIIDTSSYVMVSDVNTALISILSDGAYRGARITASSARVYLTDYAAHVLGTVSVIDHDEYQELKSQGYGLNDVLGKSGAEKAFETYLRGTDGKRMVSVNDAGKITGEYYSTAPQGGSTVELTLDLGLQKAVEDDLAATVSGMTAKDGIVRGAGAAVVGVGTGEVLALASYPTYHLATYKQDSNALNSDPAQPLFNRATSGTYAPGSTFKPCTAVAALEEGKITTSTTVNDTGKWVYPGYSDSYAWCWNHAGHGRLNVSQAITNSCNFFFAEMGYRLGLDKLNEYASAFGLGRHTGIEIGDYAGSLAQEDEGQDLAPWAAFGQASYLATPLQLANYIATLVSGGKHYDAHLLKTVKSADNSSVLYTEGETPSSTLEIHDSTLRAVKQGMHNLTTQGALTSYFKSCVVEAGAKTGTAQVSSQKVNNGVFVCFAPYDDPQIAVAIVIEKGGTGAALASTAVKILNTYFTADQIGSVVLGENQLLS